MEDFAIEEEDSREGPILGGGGDISILSQVSKKAADFGGAHIGGMVFMVKEDKVTHPIHISFLGAAGIVFETEDFTNLVQELLGHSCLTIAVRFDMLKPSQTGSSCLGR